MDEVLFACTYIEKLVCNDDYEHGCSTNSSCIMAEPVHLTADSLPALIDKLRAQFGLELDDLFIPDEDEEISSFGFNRLENGESNIPSQGELTSWRVGKTILWLADYTFSVEKRTISPLTKADFVGITTH